MKKQIILGIALAIFVAPQVLPDDTQQEMIRRVENGLLRRIQIGAPSHMNLQERIKSLSPFNGRFAGIPGPFSPAKQPEP
jgi:hypothetical protein